MMHTTSQAFIMQCPNMHPVPLYLGRPGPKLLLKVAMGSDGDSESDVHQELTSPSAAPCRGHCPAVERKPDGQVNDFQHS